MINNHNNNNNSNSREREREREINTQPLSGNSVFPQEATNPPSSTVGQNQQDKIVGSS